jgi:hypothetical protein
MKLFISGFSLILLFACGSSKKVDEHPITVPVEDTSIVFEDIQEATNELSGIIEDKTDESGCGFMIKATIDGVVKILDPGSLSDEFKVDGLAVDVSFDFARRQTTCQGSQPIIIHSIRKK